MYYKKWIAKIRHSGLYYVRKTYIMESEKRWVTIDGRHVNIGGDDGGNSGGTVSNAAGHEVKVVDHIKLIEEPDSITQKKNKSGGIDRNYYGTDGKQIKQISNHDHGHPKQHPYGRHGEHAHDYFYDDNGMRRHGKARELTKRERKENGDIL